MRARPRSQRESSDSVRRSQAPIGPAPPCSGARKRGHRDGAAPWTTGRSIGRSRTGPAEPGPDATEPRSGAAHPARGARGRHGRRLRPRPGGVQRGHHQGGRDDPTGRLRPRGDRARGVPDEREPLVRPLLRHLPGRAGFRRHVGDLGRVRPGVAAPRTGIGHGAVALPSRHGHDRRRVHLRPVP